MKLKDEKILLEAIGDGTDDYETMEDRWKFLKDRIEDAESKDKTIKESEVKDTKEDKA